MYSWTYFSPASGVVPVKSYAVVDAMYMRGLHSRREQWGAQRGGEYTLKRKPFPRAVKYRLHITTNTKNHDITI